MQSVVWKYFKKEATTSAICILYKKILKHSGNTTNLKQYLQRNHIFHLEHDDLSENHQKIVDENADKNIEEDTVNAINCIDTQIPIKQRM